MNKKETPVTFFICNPEVVLREEDSDGGLLFNPDTNQIKVINATGLFIWKLCEKKNYITAMVTELQESFSGVPQDNATDQIKKFLEEMINAGFIGIAEK